MFYEWLIRVKNFLYKENEDPMIDNIKTTHIYINGFYDNDNVILDYTPKNITRTRIFEKNFQISDEIAINYVTFKIKQTYEIPIMR